MKDFFYQCRQLYEESFFDSKGFIDHFFSHFFNRKNVVAVVKDEKIVSALHLSYKKLQIFEKCVPLAFVVAAATTKELRGQKLMESVMKSAFSRLLKEKVPFVSLNPFKHSYYQKYGFVTYTFCDEIEVLGSGKLLGQKADAISLNKIYNECMSKFDCSIVRTTDTFNYKLLEWASDNLKAEIFSVQGKSCYVVHGNNSVEEFCGNVEVLKQSAISSPKVEIFGNKKPNNMIRVVDVKSALECSKFQTDGIFEFEVVDSFFDDNSGSFLLKVENGVSTVEKTKKCCEEKISIENLTKAIFCNQPLANFGKIFVSPTSFTLDKF